MKPTSSDVLKGRGVPIMNHPGNRYFRKVVADRKSQYALMTRTADKEAVAMQVLKEIHSQTPPGRFLAQKEDSSYFSLDRGDALTKIKQALREGTDKKTTKSKEKNKESKENSKESKEKSASKPSKTSEKAISSKGTKQSGKKYDKDDMDRVLELLKKG